MSYFVFVVIILILFHVLVNDARKKSSNPLNKPENFLPRFQANLERSNATGRYEYVQKVLSMAAGVYRPGVRHRHENVASLQTTVLMTVVAANSPENEKHLIFLRNLLCFLQHHRLKLVVFYLHHENVEWKRSLEHLEHVYFVTYPDFLFWQLLVTKGTEIIEGNAYAKYDANVPSFSSFGALVMLVPVLEVLEHNFNAIFLDADVALVRDPIPYLTQSKADLTMSMESRGCQEYFSATYPNFFDYYKIEPNSGVMYARSTPAGKEMFRNWLETIIDNNFVNDQRAFHPKDHNARYDPSCHQGRDSFTPTAVKGLNLTDESPTFCYYDELWVQNGMIGITCPSKKQFRDMWVKGMYQHGTHKHSLNATVYDLMKDYDSSIATVSPHARFPVILHSNYVNDKVKEYRTRGMWRVRLHENGSVPSESLSPDLYPFCSPYHINQTMYAVMNWTEELREIHQREEHLFATYIKPHALLKALASPSIYYIGENLTRHEIPDGETFEFKFPGSWNKIEVVPYLMLLNLTLGEAIPSVGIGKKTKLSSNSSNPHTISKDDTDRHVHKSKLFPQSRYPFFVEKLMSSRNISRAEHIKRVLALASGVHKRLSTNLASSSVDKAVLLTVLSTEEPGYDRLLDNLICAMERLSYKLVVYVIDHDGDNHANALSRYQTKDWQARGVFMLTYPQALFWHLLAMKKNEILASSSRVFRVQYDSADIRFSSFGQLVKLVPILEVLHNKYSAVFIDVDVVPLNNFVDFLRRSVADIAIAKNIAKCADTFTTSIYKKDVIIGHHVQLDSSVIFVNTRGYHTFKRYIENVIHDNVYRDTDSFVPDKLMLTQDTSCHTSSDLFLSSNFSTTDDAQITRPSLTSKGTFCLLDELLFQNHFFATKCPNNADFRDDYVIQMVKQGIQVQTAKRDTVFLPYTVHFSGVKSKQSEITGNGLWTASGTMSDASSFTCKSLNLETISFAKKDWIGLHQTIVAKREEQLAMIRKNGTLVRALTGPQIYYIDEQGFSHVIPDGATFIHRFGSSSWGRIVSVPLAVLLSLPQGEALANSPQ
eukprot:gene32349-39121_t